MNRMELPLRHLHEHSNTGAAYVVHHEETVDPEHLVYEMRIDEEDVEHFRRVNVSEIDRRAFEAEPRERRVRIFRDESNKRSMAGRPQIVRSDVFPVVLHRIDNVMDGIAALLKFSADCKRADAICQADLEASRGVDLIYEFGDEGALSRGGFRMKPMLATCRVAHNPIAEDLVQEVRVGAHETRGFDAETVASLKSRSKYAIVWLKPSRSCTFGCQSSSRRA